MEVDRELARIASTASENEQADELRALAQRAVSARDEGSQAAAQGTEVPAAPALEGLAEALEGVPKEERGTLARAALAGLRGAGGGAGSGAARVREAIGEGLAEAGDSGEAARALGEMDLDGGGFSSAYAFWVCVRVATLYLEAGDAAKAESWVARAGRREESAGDNGARRELKRAYAGVLDGKRRFVEAALLYYELSQAEEQGRMEALERAIACAVLAGMSPQRSRILTMLYKDGRSGRVRTPLRIALEKVHLEKVLRPEEATELEGLLLPHHLAPGPDGLRVSQRAVLEHNLLSVSKLYRSVRLEQLASMLGVEPSHAERIASRLIADGSIGGRIDQRAGLLRFRHPDSSSLLDSRVRSLCKRANDAALLLTHKGLSPL